jgi:glycosyltransferase involved in cell wall biosynthesis
VHLAFGGRLEVAIVGASQFHEIRHLCRRVRPFSDLRAVSELRSLIRRERFDVIHTHESKAGALGRLAARGSGAIVIHSVHMPSFGSAYGRLRSGVFKAVERFCARTTDIFVVVGDELGDVYVQNGIGRADQYLTLRSPIEIDRFAKLRERSSSAVRTARAAIGIDPDVPVAVCVGRLERRKRHSLVISRLRDMLLAGELQLVIAGEGPEEQHLRQYLRHSGVTEAVSLLGYIDALDEVFLAANVLIHASGVEGVPQVVVQALAAGLPVVATSVEGLREVRAAPIIRVDREGSALAAAVAHVLRDAPGPVPVASLAAWRSSSIVPSIEAIYSLIAARAAGGVK